MTRSVKDCIPTQSVGTITSPDIPQVDRSHALRGNAYRDAPRSCLTADATPGTVMTRSVKGGIPTRSMGTINRCR